MAEKHDPREKDVTPGRDDPIDRTIDRTDDVPDLDVPDPAQHDRAKPTDDRAKKKEERPKKADGTAGSEGAGRNVGFGPDIKITSQGEEKK